MRKKYKPSSDYQKRFLSKGSVNHENFARVFRSMYEDEKYINLSGSAKDIYTGIVMNCNKDKRDRCTFPKSAYMKRCSKSTFHKAIDELEENGFIEVIHCQTLANIYRLSEDWKYNTVPKKKPIIFDKSQYYKYLKG